MKRPRLLLMIVASILVSGVLGVSSPAQATTPAWWNTAYTYRLGITITAADALASGYSLSTTIDHASLVSGGKSLASGNDVRVVRWNGTSWAELDRVLAVGSSWNSATTKISFKTQTSVSASGTDTGYYLYYGNAAAAAPPANANNVYDLFDDFSSGSLNPAVWATYTNTGTTIGVTGGELRMLRTSGSSNYGAGLYSQTIRGPGLAIESSFRLASLDNTVRNHYFTWLGVEYNTIGIGTDSAPSFLKRVGSDLGYIADSTLSGSTASPIRITQAVTSGGLVRHWEDGTLITQFSPAYNSSGDWPNFGFDPYASGAFDVRIDDIVVRKYVANEPTLTMSSLEANSEVAVSAVIDPYIGLVVSAVGTATSCGDVTTTSASSSSVVALGHLDNQAQQAIGGQNLTVTGNSPGGYSVSIGYTGPMTGQSTGRNYIDVAGTDASPIAWPSSGTEAFGYTTQAANLNGTAGRFHPSRWAALSVTPTEVMRSTTVPGANGDVNCVAFSASRAANTPADTYSTSVRYNLVATF